MMRSELFIGPLPEDAYKEVTDEFHLFKQDRVVETMARALYGQKMARQALGELESERDDVTKLLYGKNFRRQADSRLRGLNPNERRRMLPNNALVVSFDGKGLKEVNDTLGHDNGNLMLYNIGQIATEVSHPGDLVGRLNDGGDEFAAVYFFRDDLVEPEIMRSNINEHLLKLVKEAVDRGDIAGLRWSSTFFELGKNIHQHLKEADPVETINPGGVIEFPSKEVLPARS